MNVPAAPRWRRPVAAILAAAIAAGLAACRPPDAPPSGSAATPVVTAADADAAGFPAEDLAWLDIAGAGARMAEGTLSSVALTEAYLARIAAIDDAGPTLNAVVEVNPDALAIAAERDRERAAGRVRGPLHGIPVLLKDNIDTGDRMHTTAGALVLAAHVAPGDAFVVARLREAGAVLLGKTNLSEWANFRSRDSISGWSTRGGQTRNPWALDRNPCGSSSGSAAAVAAGLATVAVGTETDGSIICPAQANGLVGIKPTVGLVSRSGIIPIAASQDTAGPMARSVADAALLLAAMRGVDPADPATAAAAAQVDTDYAAALRADALRGRRIGVLRAFASFHGEVDAMLTRAAEILRRAGAEVVDPVELPHRGSYGADEYTVLLHEFRDGVERYFAERAPAAPVRTLSELVDWNAARAETTMPWFGQDILIAAARTAGLDDPAYRAARERARRLAGPEGIDAALAAHRLDALLAPSGGMAWLVDGVNGDTFGGGSAQPAAVAGYPNVTVPAGLVRGLPIGVSFIGGAWQEAALIGYAHAFEQARGPLPRPRFVQSLPRP